MEKKYLIIITALAIILIGIIAFVAINGTSEEITSIGTFSFLGETFNIPTGWKVKDNQTDFVVLSDDEGNMIVISEIALDPAQYKSIGFSEGSTLEGCITVTKNGQTLIWLGKANSNYDKAEKVIFGYNANIKVSKEI